MPETYGYVRTSRPRVSELSGSDPETQRQQLLAAGGADTLWTPGWPRTTPWLWCP